MLLPWQLRARVSSSSSAVRGSVAVGPGFFARDGLVGETCSHSLGSIHLLVVGDPWACRMAVHWEANQKDSEMIVQGRLQFIDGGGDVVSGTTFAP